MIKSLFLAVCLAFALSLPAAAQNVLHRGNGAEPGSLDPHFISGSWEFNIVGDMFLGLMTEDIRGEAIPGAAESFTRSADGRTYTFILREGATWSDGVPVTAEDFVFSFRRILNPETAAEYASLLYVIENAQAVNSGALAPEEVGVTALDARTLKIRLTNPAPYFIELLTHFTTYPVPAHVVSAHGKEWIKPENIVSNGPYTLVEWRSKDFIRLQKNPLFYDADNVAIEEVNFYPSSDQSAALKRFRAGEIDLNTGAPPQQLDWMRENMPEELRIAPYVAVAYLAINTRRAPFDDVRIRQALAMTIERELFTDCILRAGQSPAYAFVPPGIANYSSGAEMAFKGLSRDERLAQARALLEEAGFDRRNPLRFDFSYRENTTGRRIAVLLQAMWKEIGPVQAELLRTEVRVHYNNLRAADFDVGDAGWIADYNDAQNFLFLLEGSTGQMNYGQYNNADFNRLMQEAAVEQDLGARADLLRAAEEIMLTELPLVPLYFSVSLSLVHQYVSGWEDNVTNVHRTRYMRVDDRARAQRFGRSAPPAYPKLARVYGTGCG